MRISLTLLFCLMASPAWAEDAKPPTGWTMRTINGFTVLVHDEVLQQPVDRWHRKPLDVLETEFDDLKRVAGPRLSEMLRQVPVWVRWNAHDPGMPSAVMPRSCRRWVAMRSRRHTVDSRRRLPWRRRASCGLTPT